MGIMMRGQCNDCRKERILHIVKKVYNTCFGRIRVGERQLCESCIMDVSLFVAKDDTVRFNRRRREVSCSLMDDINEEK